MTIIEDFFRLINPEIDYCNWKSIDRMDDVYASTSDIDILVKFEDRHKFKTILEQMQAINVKPRLWMTYPSMDDYLLFDKNTGKTFHLHVHYRLIMGKKNAKEYVLPMEDLYFNTRLKHEKYETYIVAPEVDLIMLILRYSVKYSPFHKYYQKLRRFKVGEVKEMEYLIPRCDKKNLVNIAQEFDNLLGLGTIMSDFIREERYKKPFSQFFYFRRIKRGLKLYQRISNFEIWGIRKLRKYLNIYAKLGRNNAKHPIQGGITIAMVGADGSGKTTVTDAVIKDLRTKLSARKYYLGFNARSFSWKTKVLAFLSYMPRGAKFILKNDLGKKINIFGQMIIEYGGYLDRKKLYQIAMRDKANGMIGFFERYPLENTIDYPQFYFNPDDQKIIKSSKSLTQLAHKLKKKYEIFKPADINLFIRTEPEIIRSRREMSEKTYKKVCSKFDRVQQYIDKKDYFITIDGSQSLEKVILDVKNEIFKKI